MPIDIAILDDHPLLIKGLRSMLQHYHDMRVTATYNDGNELLEGLKNEVPDVLILDIQMPEITGDELAPMLHQQYPQLKVLVLSHMEHEYYIKAMFNYGIAGYVLKSSKEEILLQAIRWVHKGRQFLDSALKTVIDEVPEKSGKSPFLTQREIEVLRLIAEDYNSNEIAEKLFISKRTVDNHRINLLIKLGAKGSANLIKKAMEWSLIP